MTKKASDRQLAAALRKHGVIAHAAEELGITRQSAWARVQSKPHLKAILDDVDAEVGEKARGNLITAVKAGDVQASKWWLERRDPAFKATQSWRLDEDQAAELVKNLGPDALKALAGRV